jgi:CheY-like chemotaxis protein
LGLAITSELIRAMGGFRSVRSELGRGSAFAFTIPLILDAGKKDAVPATSDPEPQAKPKLQKIGPAESRLSVLLAEDTPTNQMLVVHTLKKRGHQIEVASDGLAAVQLAESKPFDVILMDLQMPGMDGFEATAAIRALPGRDRTPIVALTAHTMVGDRERCLAAGMEDYLPKPLDLRRLIDVVEACGQLASTRTNSSNSE